MTGADLDHDLVRKLVEAALMEDRAWHDITTDALVPEEQTGRAALLAKHAGVLAGMPLAQETFAACDASLAWSPRAEDGHPVAAGDTLAEVSGSLASILRGERVALNYLSHLSGIATAARALVDAIKGTDCRLRDTRKTTPGLRVLEKYAVRMGGGVNHRLDLASGILIKDNHLAALRARGFGIAEAVALARQAQPHAHLEIEVTSVPEAQQAIEAGAAEILLDNMSLAEMREVVAMAAGRAHRPVLEASGGVTLENARAVAETGVDFIAIGAVTHSAHALDISLEVVA